MSENVHAFIGIIELAACPGDARRGADDSSLDRLLSSLAEHDWLTDELAPPHDGSLGGGWRRMDDESHFGGQVSVAADLAMLVDDLEREYAQLCESLDS